ncbi:unnamed protein product [Adineta ricciae]|uniref:Uncharacterized protein n=1 Tax=Adineta ricciae TaxID=249248 RepID=A0A813UNK8_ADIRI|nr:unnamed protein product [Adineta ricciae]CAF1298774.1 unnamed protein product [Adineta ricciae]
MEQISISELKDELNEIDVDSIKLDAVIQLKTWQKKMHSLINKTYADRMHEIDSIVSNAANEVREKQNQLRHCQKNDRDTLTQLKADIDSLKSSIVIIESIPDNFEQRIERTVRVCTRNEDADTDDVFIDEEEEDDDDEPVIVDIDRHETRSGDKILVVATAPTPVSTREGTVSRIFNSRPVQNAIATGITRTLVNVGTIAATSTTTVAATTMAKTALIATACGVGTVAYGVGKIAMGTTRKVWSLVMSSDD